MTHRPRPLRRALVAAAAACLLTLTACGQEPPADENGSTLASSLNGTDHAPYQLSATTLTDTDGEAYTLAEDATKPLTLVFFGYTNCPTECPIVMNTLASAMVQLSPEEREQVDVVFVTSDPARDTPTVLRSYLDRYDPEFIGLTGDLADILQLAESMRMFVADAEALDSGGYDLNSHATYVSAVEQEGATVLWNMETTPQQLVDDIRTLLKDA